MNADSSKLGTFARLIMDTSSQIALINWFPVLVYIDPFWHFSPTEKKQIVLCITKIFGNGF